MPYLHISSRDQHQSVIHSDVLDVVIDHFSADNPVPRNRRTRFVPTRHYAITPTGRFDKGMAMDIIRFARSTWRSNIDVQVDDETLQWLQPKCKMVALTPPNIAQLRPYQATALDKAIKRGRGIILHPTAAGKTPLTAAILHSYITNHTITSPCVVMVPDTGLARQTTDSLVEMGIPGTVMWTGKSPLQVAPDTTVVVCNFKIAWLHEQTLDTLVDAPILIVDECHTVTKGTKVVDVIKKFTTNNKFGLTGTLPDKQVDQWTVKGLIGPVIVREDAVELQQQGWIAPVTAVAVHMTYKGSPPKVPVHISKLAPTSNYRSEVQWLYDNSYRNQIVSDLAVQLKHNTLVLVDRLQLGESMLQLCTSKTDKQCYFIHGKVDVDVREQIKAVMEANNDVVCIAMVHVFHKGVSINNLHNIILASRGKGRSRLVQSVGRGRRLNGNKNKLTLFDICDETKYSIVQNQHRLAVYEAEQIPVVHKYFRQPC